MKMLRYVSPALLLSTNLMAGESVKIGGQFRGELMHNTNKSAEAAGAASGSKEATGQQAFVSFSAMAHLSDKAKFESELQFLNGGGSVANCAGSLVRTGKVTWWHQDFLSVAIGCSQAKSGGWDFATYNSSQSIRAFNPANSVKPGDTTFSYVPNIKAFNPSIEVGLHMFGDLTLQLMDDVANTASGWNTKTTQTWNVEWKGDLFGIQPILQYGMYDAGHSHHYDIGLMLDVSNLSLKVDYMSVGHSVKTAKTATKSESKMNQSNRMSVELAYNMMGWTPSLYYSNYMNKPKTDPKANSAAGTWDHDGQVLTVAVATSLLGANFSPYVAFDWQSGKFKEGTDNKTKSDTIIRIGGVAHF